MKKCGFALIVVLLFISGCLTYGIVIPIPRPMPEEETVFAPPFEIAWTRCLRSTKEPIEIYPFELSEPVYADGKVIVGSRSGAVFCLELSSGAKIWEFKTAGPVESTAAIADGFVYIGDDAGYLYALDFATGKKVWSYRVPEGEIIDKVAHSKGYVAFATTANNLVLLSSKDGEFLWMQTVDPVSPITVRGFGSPIFYNGLVIAGFADGTLRAFEEATGKPVWQIELKTQGDMRDVDSDPLIVGDLLFVATYRGNIYAIDLINNSIIWRHDAGSVASPAVDLGRIFFSTDTGMLLALDSKSGNELWKISISKIDVGSSFVKSSLVRFATAPVYQDGYLIFGTSRGNLAVVDAESGKLVFKRHLSSSISARPLVAENKIVVHTDQDCLYAFVPQR